MIKANELVFEGLKYEICDGLYFEIEDFCGTHTPDPSLGEGWIAGLYAADTSATVCIWYLDRLKTSFAAKAACQDHYQQMVEGMVDMGHLKNIIKAAIAQGLACQPLLYPDKYPVESMYIQNSVINAVDKAYEDFIKTLEQRGSQ